MSEQQQGERPRRIQRKRTKGWKIPPNTVVVSRPSRWGNPWTIAGYYDAGYSGSTQVASMACVDEYRGWLTRSRSPWSGMVPTERIRYRDAVVTPPTLDDIRAALAGKHLACWCKPGEPCHADVLLELANASAVGRETGR